MKIERPTTGTYLPYFDMYISRVSENDVLEILGQQPAEVRKMLGGLSEESAGHRYAPGKWSVREVIGHINDSERVFAYRLLCIGRGDTNALPGFDEGMFAANGGHDRCSLGGLLDEFEVVRRGSLFLLRHLDEEALARVGTANGHPTAVLAIPWIMAGHVRHHLGVLKDKYSIG